MRLWFILCWSNDTTVIYPDQRVSPTPAILQSNEISKQPYREALLADIWHGINPDTAFKVVYPLPINRCKVLLVK